MKYLLIFFIMLTYAGAENVRDVYNNYQNKNYLKACKIGEKLLSRHQEDEKFVSLYAFSCLKADRIDNLAKPIVLLTKSEEARSNAAYFSVILMQKKLLLHALLDTYNFKSLKLPTTDYVLSKVFDLYVNSTDNGKKHVYAFTDPENNKQSYRLFITRDASKRKIVIEEYYDTILTKRHIYR
ncbi:MAG: hypothetical protein B5M52_03415 [Helicobacteraceae bacterium 4484_230]|nr:MAG: hypothetical protein B5M52_03415 [Helicobacteraceae bacterium 4484_230]